MPDGLLFVARSALFGVGLAMDAFSVSAVNALAEPNMKFKKMCAIAGTFAAFQIAMPLIGWFFVRAAAQRFAAFQRAIPWIALILLLYIGGKMLVEGIRERRASAKLSGGNGSSGAPAPVEVGDASELSDSGSASSLGAAELLLQGIATSIDALSVGFTIADLKFAPAALEALIIGAVTFAICMGGLRLGRRLGEKIGGRASILGGIILIAIGLEIFISA